jgi:hypothetical protein
VTGISPSPPLSSLAVIRRGTRDLGAAHPALVFGSAPRGRLTACQKRPSLV